MDSSNEFSDVESLSSHQMGKNFEEDIENVSMKREEDEDYDFEDDFIASESEPTIYDEEEEEEDFVWVQLHKKDISRFEKFMKHQEAKHVKRNVKRVKIQQKRRVLMVGYKFDKLQQRKQKGLV
jgi:hypothetical protein